MGLLEIRVPQMLILNRHVPFNNWIILMIYLVVPHFQTNLMIHPSMIAHIIPIISNENCHELLEYCRYPIFSAAPNQAPISFFCCRNPPFPTRLKRKVGKQLPSWGCQRSRSIGSGRWLLFFWWYCQTASSMETNDWLVVCFINFIFPFFGELLGISASQLTFICFRGVAQPKTSFFWFVFTP